MTKEECIRYMKLMLTGDVLHLELSDETLGSIVDAALAEIQRYIDQTKFMTIPFAKCIDLTGSNVSSVTAVYRTKGYLSSNDETLDMSDIDPFQAQIWKVFSNNGNMYNLNDYVLNFASFATLLQMRSAQSTDLAFRVDLTTKRLYINVADDAPVAITIEYVPKMLDVSDIVSDFWIDQLKRLCVALTKQLCGRVRSRYTASSSLWRQDGDTLLAEANAELEAIREQLRANSVEFYPVD